MIRIAVVGKIGSGKSFIANLFKLPTFNADREVSQIYKKNKICFKKLKKKFPNLLSKHPVKKKELVNIILKKDENLKKIIKIVHPLVRRKLNTFLKKNRKKEAVVLDIPLFLENKLNKKNDIIIFIDSKKKDILNKLKERKEYNAILIKKFENIQLSPQIKKKKSNFIVKNNFTIRSAQNNIKNLKLQIFE